MEKKVHYYTNIMEYIQLCNYNGEKGMLLMYNGVYTIM